MVSKTLIILAVFCGLLLVQAACASGWLLHCDHPPQLAHGQEHCPDDHCQDDFPVPGKLAPPALQTAGPAALASCRPAPVWLQPLRLLRADQPGVSPAARPSGSFPLLI